VVMDERYLPFGDILTSMEREGILVNRDFLAEMQVLAERDAGASSERFLNWAVCGGRGSIEDEERERER
jgi:hypothetical protein